MVTDIRKGKILVVDDEAPMRRCIRKGLTLAGYEYLLG
jgi:DNA-binding response OmpR family regulator